jgi:hypothetical protein
VKERCSEAGYRRCQGETMRSNSRLKTVLESSVRSKTSRVRASMQPALGRYFSMTGCAHLGHAAATSRFGARSVLPGVQPFTYRTTGFFLEHGNLDPSAEPAKLGKPTSPAMSRTGGGVSVVVRAREIRVHGEGRQ